MGNFLYYWEFYYREFLILPEISPRELLIILGMVLGEGRGELLEIFEGFLKIFEDF